MKIAIILAIIVRDVLKYKLGGCLFSQREKEIMKKILSMISMVLLGLLLMACGRQKEMGTTFEMNKKGEITSTIVEEFSEDYLDADELKQLVLREISEYNAISSDDAIKISKLHQKNKDNPVTVIMKYKSAEDYGAFNDLPTFYGTLTEAAMHGYDVNGKLFDPEGENGITAEELKEMQGHHLLVVSESMTVNLPGKIVGISDCVEKTGKKEARVTLEKGSAYILTK